MDGAVVMEFDVLKKQILSMKTTLDERAYRIYLGQLPVSMGRGGRTLISKLSGSSVNTVKRGMEEAKEKQQNLENASEAGDTRIRKKGGGGKSASEHYSNLHESIEKIIDGSTYGDPERIIHWTTKNPIQNQFRSVPESVRFCL